MYADNQIRRNNIRDITKLKGERPVVSLTAYTAPMAARLDPHVDFLLVGDSLAMVLYGMESTIGVSLNTMIEHTKAVMRGSQKALVILDMPFGSFEQSKEQAFKNASRVLRETGCAAVKLEGGAAMAETIRFLVDRNIPVMAHIGLRPQAVHVMGGYRTQGKNEEERIEMLNDAFAIQEAGAFAVVLEGVAVPLAAQITEKLDIITIGIGASVDCDGQILVVEDMLGYFPGNAKFVKRYAEIGETIDSAVKQYADDVKAKIFPGLEHTYGLKPKS
ncbi:3-methyl-2-oxobutanoate hydroxymethyltransferase [hydrothermal vent metagenome]|uniref:3-methyl-2-oxobutanoate hydroxymethyltransferase n=1 Tax=hydrothermal vent metagenome TaxID=652676 RepID=A0A3B1B6U3_9ZZZZ